MSVTKSEKLLMLYEAIGEIDEKTATEALTYKHRSNIKGIRLTVALAAAVCVLAATLVVGMNIALGGAKSEDPRAENGVGNEGDPLAPGNAVATDSEEEAETVEDCETTVAATTPPSDALEDVFDESVAAKDKIEFLQNILSKPNNGMTQIENGSVGTVLNNRKLTVIWSDEVGTLYARTFESDSAVNKLKEALRTGISESIGDDEVPTYKIWISFGDGSVVTPFLEYLEENIYQGMLPDYSPKLVPSDDFLKTLANILENN